MTTAKHELDYVADNTNEWSIALSRTKALTRWLELHRTHTLQLAWARGWMSSLQLEHELASLATKLGLDCWLRHAGKDTLKLLENGGLRNMVVEVINGIHNGSEETPAFNQERNA